jgi:hypothetical protein
MDQEAAQQIVGVVAWGGLFGSNEYRCCGSLRAGDAAAQLNSMLARCRACAAYLAA